MLDPPFLELQYYVGQAAMANAVHALVDEIDRNLVPRKLVIQNAVGLCDKSEELEVIGGVLILRTEGELFCGPERENQKRLRKLGRRVYERFLEVADRIPCVYGAILVEYSLEDPTTLRRDPRSLAFRDFFLNREHLGETVLRNIVQHAGNDVYMEQRKAGLYISMSPEFNPEGRGIPSVEAQNRSARISAVIGRSAR